MSEDPITYRTKQGEAWAAGVSALSVFVGMQVCAEAIKMIAETNNRPLKAALFSGLIVQYARAFEEARHDKTGISRSFSFKKISSENFDRKLHDAILELRYGQAHAGHDLNDYSLAFLSLKVGLKPVDELGEQPRFAKVIAGTRARASVAIGPDDLATIKRVVEHLSSLEHEASVRLVEAIFWHNEHTLARLRLEPEVVESEKSLLSSRKFGPIEPGTINIGEEDFTFSRAGFDPEFPLAQAVYTARIIDRGDTFGLNYSLSTRPSTYFDAE